MGQARIDPRQIFVPGAVLGGRYRIDAVLGMYGAQVTLLATRSDQQRVVIETLAVERLARRARLLDQLFREAKIPRLFNRPNMVEILDFGVEPTTSNPFLVLAFDPNRPPQAVMMPSAPEKLTAASFVEVCHGLLDAHDGAFLAPANAMPTAIPGAIPTRVPTPMAPPMMPPAPRPVKPPKKRVAAKASAKEDHSPVRWRWVLASLTAALLVYWLLPNPSDNARYSNPNLTTSMIFYNRTEEGPDPRTFYQGAVEALEITSDPPGAEVWSGDEMVGTTPTKVEKPRGSDRVSYVIKKKGYVSTTVALTFDSEDVEVELNETKTEAPKDQFIASPKARKGLLDLDPLDPEAEDRFGTDPMRKAPYTNPFGAPGTAPRLPEVSVDPYADIDDDL